MKIAAFMLPAACLCFLLGCGDKPADTGKSSGNPLTAPADYVEGLGKAQNSAKRTLSAVGLDQAIKTFYTEQGRLPKDLDELVSKGTISEIPPAPRGMKYDYDAKTGVIKVVPQ
jgi:hypothetical protein